jgi:hypothetical protein
MNLRQNLTRKLWSAIPHDEQEAMVYDFLDWLFSDLTPAERHEKAKRMAPRLMGWVAEGKIGLSLVVYQHFKRLPFVSMLSQWAGDLHVTVD